MRTLNVLVRREARFLLKGYEGKRIGGFEVDSLAARREVAVLSFGLKLMNGDARGVLKQHVPELYEPLRLTKKRTRQVLDGKQLKSRVRTNSLDVYRTPFFDGEDNCYLK